jgi:2',3'-cyclic-nucleotide 2'-phosphodiesterase (5'-nucleotidase family)
MRRGERIALSLLGLLWAGLSLLPLNACTPATRSHARAEATGPVVVTVFYTNDEHGWLEGLQPGHGASALYAQVRALAHAHHAELWLSGGDNWTGPAISTWFQGRSTVEVMRRMDYAASAVGNHEFDFGLDALRARIDEAGFPYLAANMVDRRTGRVPEDLGIRSHVVLEVAGLKLGVIGLITTTTPRVTNPANVVDYDFLPYEPALREAAAEARAAGAQALIVLAHVCVDELRQLAGVVEDLEVAFFGGGHCNESQGERVGKGVLMSTGGGFSELGVATLKFERRSGELLESSWSHWPNEGRPGETALTPIIERWRRRTNEQLGRVLTTLPEALERRSPRLEQLIARSWLEAIPSGEVALLNRGGVRAGLPAGEVTMADVVAVLPFQNVIIEAEVPGAVLERAIAAHRPIVGGLQRGDSGWVLSATGEALQPDRRYRVLANSFCFAGGDDWTFLAESDPDAYDTGIHFRQPLIDALREKAVGNLSPKERVPDTFFTR